MQNLKNPVLIHSFAFRDSTQPYGECRSHCGELSYQGKVSLAIVLVLDMGWSHPTNGEYNTVWIKDNISLDSLHKY